MFKMCVVQLSKTVYPVRNDYHPVLGYLMENKYFRENSLLQITLNVNKIERLQLRSVICNILTRNSKTAKIILDVSIPNHI